MLVITKNTEINFPCSLCKPRMSSLPCGIAYERIDGCKGCWFIFSFCQRNGSLQFYFSSRFDICNGWPQHLIITSLKCKSKISCQGIRSSLETLVCITGRFTRTSLVNICIGGIDHLGGPVKYVNNRLCLLYTSP